MKKFLEIAKIQIMNMIKSTVRSGSNGSKGIVLFLVIVVSLIFASATYSMGIYSSLPVGYKDLVLYTMTSATVLLVFIFSITTAQGQLFQFKDFDLLMTWPISRTTVFLAKVLSFVIMMYMYCFLFLLPALVIFGIYESMGILYYIFGFLGILFLPLIPITISSLLAFLIRKLAGNGKHKNLLINLGSIILFGGIMIGSFSLSSMEGTVIPEEVLVGVVNLMKTYLYPVYIYVHGAITGNVIDFILVVVINGGVFALFVYLFSKTFITINSTVQNGYKAKNFKLRKGQGKSPLFALCNKEISKFTSNMMYFMNMGMGQVMLVIGGIYLMLNRETVFQMLQQFDAFGFEVMPMLFGLVCVAICLFAFMTPTSSVSISLEGKQFWITKTLPVATTTIFISKALANAFVIWVPSSIGLLTVSIGLGFSILEILMGLLLVFVLGIFVGLFGLCVNINFPKLEFDREIIVIKQSMSSFISIFGGMILGFAIIFIYVNATSVMDPKLFILLLIGIISLLDVAFWFYLKTSGVRKFYELY
ncbi:putative ABC transporter permease subunit [Anaerorhabdus sp.]|uniref:putative ABC transporter permease subunit n=1 Tax=Anaerorhabdus sp. TaxID=1872524 RepID=UPI002FC9E817